MHHSKRWNNNGQKVYTVLNNSFAILEKTVSQQL